MRKSVITILLLVAALFTVHYAIAEDMTVEEIKAEQTRRGNVYRQYDAWISDLDFDSILSDVSSEDCGLGEICAAGVREMATRWNELISECTIENDPFVGETHIISNLLSTFADGCQVYPYLDQYGLVLVLGFPYDESFHYDQIYLKFGEEIVEYDRFDKSSGFDIRFETFFSHHWEYSVLSLSYFEDEPLEAVSFRQDGSIRKVNYTMTDEEIGAFSVLKELSELREGITKLISDWYREMV